ncbi:hypothetical protein CSAL01_05512 [Colletotrichum salicis]|uniref:Uncharacterized protein n=1 Tax=Colletotrichum salicis TaxID=1209931 RepID=A0A135UP63_9PEZI|nr:hypothetical protein CSAL01_05512 [Colletotrichum salicis]
MLGELSWLLAILLWGTSKVLSAHYYEEYYANKDKKQQTEVEHSTRWEFGQVLPVLLLAAPLVAVLGTFASAEKPSETNQSRDRIEVPRTSFGNIASGYDRPQQSDGDTWDLTTLSTTGSRSIVGRQHENDLSHGDTSYVEPSITNSQNQDSVRRNLFARDYYNEALWVPPWIIISFMMIWVHIFFLFWYATDVFLVEDPYNSKVAGKTSDSLDYLFDPSYGVFSLIVASYPVVGHSFIL